MAACGFAELETINFIAASTASAPSHDRFVPEVFRGQEVTGKTRNS